MDSPSPQVLRVAPILLVKDIYAAVAFWRDKVGFETDKIWGMPPNFAMPERCGVKIMLQQAPSDHVIVPKWKISRGCWDAYLWVDDAETMYQELIQRGCPIDYELGRKPYNVLEFGIQDLEGHDIAIGQVL